MNIKRELNDAEKIAQELLAYATKIGAGSVFIAVSVPSPVTGDPWWGYAHGQQVLGADNVAPGVLGVMALKDMGAFGPAIIGSKQ